MQTHSTPLYRNKAGIPVFVIKTARVAAAYWDGDFNFKTTTAVVKFVKNR